MLQSCCGKIAVEPDVSGKIVLQSSSGKIALQSSQMRWEDCAAVKQWEDCTAADCKWDDLRAWKKNIVGRMESQKTACQA